MIFGPDGLATCGNPECHIFMWDQAKTLAQLADNMSTLDIRRHDGPAPG
jgi:hypothetical protein